MDIVVTGADEFARAARLLKEAGDKDLRKELFAGLNRSVKPLTQDVKQALPDVLPNRYAGVVQSEFKVKIRRRSGGRNPAIFLLGRAGSRNVSSLDRGRLRHPLYGNRRRWYDQRIQPGFWTLTLERDTPRVRVELVEAIRKVIAKIEAGI